MFLGNDTREKPGFVSYVSFSLCFDFDPKHEHKQYKGKRSERREEGRRHYDTLLMLIESPLH